VEMLVPVLDFHLDSSFSVGTCKGCAIFVFPRLLCIFLLFVSGVQIHFSLKIRCCNESKR